MLQTLPLRSSAGCIFTHLAFFVALTLFIENRAHWKRRPKKPGGAAYAFSLCKHTIRLFKHFLKWLHKSPAFPWKRPADLELDRVKVVPDRETKIAVDSFVTKFGFPGMLQTNTGTDRPTPVTVRHCVTKPRRPLPSRRGGAACQPF
jgi:hypothetical protein